MEPSVFDSFAQSDTDIFDQFLLETEPIKAKEPPTLKQKLEAQRAKARAHAATTQQNYTASRLPEGLRLGFA
jgi:hypothetical protein